MLEGAWDLANDSPINVLSDKELMGVLVRSTPHRESGSEDVIGAWFGSTHDGAFSFDLVVDPAYQNQGAGKMLFDAGCNEADWSGHDKIQLEVCNPAVARMAQRAGFTHLSASREIGCAVGQGKLLGTWEKEIS